MGLMKFLMKKAVPIPKIEKCESFAFVGPHPDDIEVGCGATAAKLAAMGKRICFIIATDGAFGGPDPDIPPEQVVEMRKKEAAAAAALLGVKDVRFLGFPDGGQYDIYALRDKIAAELAKFKPDIIFCVDNHVKSEIHPDHLQTGRATEMALLSSGFLPMMRAIGINEKASPKGIAYYYTDRPNSYINITKYYSKKIEALRAHKSQFVNDAEMEKVFKSMCLYFKLTAVRGGLHSGCRLADGYRVLSSLHLHCAPEAADF